MMPLIRQFNACAADELTLRALTWNVRASLELHVPTAKTLEAKVSNLAALVAQHGASLCALQECPGEKLAAAGARRHEADGDGDGEEAPEAKVALPPLRQLVQRCPQLRGWDYAEAQTRGEAAGFAYDAGVLQLLHGPVAHYAPKPADGVAAFEFQRPPVLVVFARKDDTPMCAHAAPLGLLAVVSVHLRESVRRGDQVEANARRAGAPRLRRLPALAGARHRRRSSARRLALVITTRGAPHPPHPGRLQPRICRRRRRAARALRAGGLGSLDGVAPRCAGLSGAAAPAAGDKL